MCRASSNLRDLIDIIETSKQDHSEIKQEMSAVDLLKNDILHQIEFGEFNIIDGYIKLKQLQFTLQARRVIKNELDLMQVLMSKLNCIERPANQLYELISYREDRLKHQSYHPRVLRRQLYD